MKNNTSEGPKKQWKRLCASEGCEKLSQGRKTNLMCMFHFKESGGVAVYRRCCVEGCAKQSKGRKTKYMCIAHHKIDEKKIEATEALLSLGMNSTASKKREREDSNSESVVAVNARPSLKKLCTEAERALSGFTALKSFKHALPPPPSINTQHLPAISNRFAMNPLGLVVRNDSIIAPKKANIEDQDDAKKSSKVVLRNCKVSGCPKWSQGLRKKHMCNAHYTKSFDDTVNATSSTPEEPISASSHTTSLTSSGKKDIMKTIGEIIDREKKSIAKPPPSINDNKFCQDVTAKKPQNVIQSSHKDLPNVCKIPGCSNPSDGIRTRFMCRSHNKQEGGMNRFKCQHSGCEKRSQGKRAGHMCVAHFREAGGVFRSNWKACKVDGCSKQSKGPKAGNMCLVHYRETGLKEEAERALGKPERQLQEKSAPPPLPPVRTERTSAEQLAEFAASVQAPPPPSAAALAAAAVLGNNSITVHNLEDFDLGMALALRRAAVANPLAGLTGATNLSIANIGRLAQLSRAVWPNGF